jgi:hypothetical protein
MMPELRAGHNVILAEILAQCKHEIGSVIRREATQSGSGMASALSSQKPLRAVLYRPALC